MQWGGRGWGGGGGGGFWIQGLGFRVERIIRFIGFILIGFIHGPYSVYKAGRVIIEQVLQG